MNVRMHFGAISLLLWLVLGTLPVGCANIEEIHLTAADNGRQIDISRGQILVITLESNITTGYEWDIAEFDDHVLALQGEPEYLEPGTELVGAGGQEVYRFECVGTGQTDLRLIYHRPFENEEPSETFTLEIGAR